MKKFLDKRQQVRYKMDLREDADGRSDW